MCFTYIHGINNGTSMPSHLLSVAKVNRLTSPGRHADGGCLFLVIKPSGAKQWVARLTIRGRQTDLGLGGISYVTLAEARDETLRLRRIARSGGDPRLERRQTIVTFEDAAVSVHQSLLPTWKNTKHAETWLATMEKYTFPAFGSRSIESIGPAEILSILTPIWTEKHETAKRLKQRISAVFDWAKSAGHYPHENPVHGIQRALPNVKRPPQHMPAMAWSDVPTFMNELARRDGMSARCLEFVILTAARSGEGRGGRWDEIRDGTWTVPGERMKRGVIHRVPLSSQAKSLLVSVAGLDPFLIFPSRTPAKDGSPRAQSDAVFAALLKRMGRTGFTVHGFRSSFRDWCSEEAQAEREVAEAALSHAVGNQVERSYARSDLFERRAKLMQQWADFICGSGGGQDAAK